MSAVTALPTIADLEVDGRTTLVRADLNVPLDGETIADDFRLRAAVTTIRELRSRGARVVTCSHLGRPTGADPAFSMRHIGPRLAELGGFDVAVAADVAGEDSRRLLAGGGDAVVLLENTRFEPGETKNDPALAARLARLADVFVLDAFGSAHRAHSSTAGVATLLPSAVGLLLAEEIRAFERLLQAPDSPYVVVLGGAKVSDKLGVITALLPKVDSMLIGGAMCFTVLAARGHQIGDSLVEADRINEIRAVLDRPEADKIILPVDIVAADRFAADSPHRVVPAGSIPSGTMGLDIGPETARHYSEVLGSAATIFWNGPMGVFEWDAFAAGTRTVAAAIVESTAFSVAGGGDSVAALRAMGLEGGIGHLSTGGGAGLELIEQGTLPAVEAVRSSPRGGDPR